MYGISFSMRGVGPEDPPKVVIVDQADMSVYIRISEPAVKGEHTIEGKTYPALSPGPNARAILALLNQEDPAELNGLADELEVLVQTVAGQLADVTEIFINYLGTISRKGTREEIASTVSELGTMRAQMLAIMDGGVECIRKDGGSA